MRSNFNVKIQGHWERKCENDFHAYFPEKNGQFTSNQDQNDSQAILHISSNTSHQ